MQCDDNEQAYLKVLMDEVFGRENFIGTIVYKRRKSQANLAKNISPIHDFIIIFAKQSRNNSLNTILTEIDETKYSNPDSDSRGKYVTMPCTNQGGGKYKVTTPTGKIIEDEWRFKEATYLALKKDNKIVFPNNGNGKPRYKLFLKDKKASGNIPNTWWDNIASTQEGSEEIKKIFTEKIFAHPKPEALLERILQIATKPGDIVLDFCLGSGTTCAVAHKMGRQYIGIEQMDYIENIAVERLTKVIDGEQGGISKAVQWQGGGDFVYCELKKHNQAFIDRITTATTTEELIAIKADILSNIDIDYCLETEAVAKNTEDFSLLNLEQQQHILIDFLELNQLYVPYTERKDTRFACTQDEIQVSEAFYTGGIP